MTTGENSFYAAMLRLTGRLCIVVGGGKVASRKVEKLLDAGATVRVISPEVSSLIATYARQRRIEHIPREYRQGDAEQGFLVIAATDHWTVNQRIADDADFLGKFVNVVDDPTRCSFMVPATYVHRGLEVAVSTQGQDPATAKRLKNALESDFFNGTRNFQDEMEHWWQQHENGTETPPAIAHRQEGS